MLKQNWTSSLGKLLESNVRRAEKVELPYSWDKTWITFERINTFEKSRRIMNQTDPSHGRKQKSEIKYRERRKI